MRHGGAHRLSRRKRARPPALSYRHRPGACTSPVSSLPKLTIPFATSARRCRCSCRTSFAAPSPTRRRQSANSREHKVEVVRHAPVQPAARRALPRQQRPAEAAAAVSVSGNQEAREGHEDQSRGCAASQILRRVIARTVAVSAIADLRASRNSLTLQTSTAGHEPCARRRCGECLIHLSAAPTRAGRPAPTGARPFRDLPRAGGAPARRAGAAAFR